jgi:signal transduction histidine kinase/CheY-like chemotaxis protein
MSSLRAKITVLAVAVSLVPILIVSLALTGVNYSTRRSDVLTQQQDSARQMAGQAAEVMSEIQQSLDMIARTSNWGASAAGERQILIDMLQGTQTQGLSSIGIGAFDEVLLLDGSGKLVVARSPTRLAAADPWIQQVRNEALETVLRGEIYQGTVYIAAGEVPALDLAVPTRDMSGRITGLLWGSTNLDRALQPLIAAPGIPGGTDIYVFDNLGYLVARNDGQPVERSVAPKELVPVKNKTRWGVSEGIDTYQGLTGEKVVGAWQPVKGLGWTVVVETPTDLAFADNRQLLLLTTLLSLVTIGTAAGTAILASRTLTQPLERLSAGAEAIDAGDLEHLIQVENQDETGRLAEAFNQMVGRVRAYQTEIARLGHEMESQVEKRTRELVATSRQMRRRALQLQASAEVARAIASTRDLDELLPQVAALISERFGWYHVGIFLIDRKGEFAVLQAANSEGGQKMLARGHRLRVGETGIVGHVTSSGRARIALDVGEDAVYFDTPELRGTRSEMALPLIAGEQIIGALDVQSSEPSAYDGEDVALLGILADQVAIAIANARLFEQTKQALEEVEALHRQYVLQEWTQSGAVQGNLAYEYRRRGAPVLDSGFSTELSTALTEGKVVAFSEEADAFSEDDGGDGHSRAVLAAPIKYRDQVIGALDLEEVDEPRQWTQDEIALVQAVSDQVALALENARLFADTQRRAEQLATLHRVGLDVTSALDLDGVLNALYEQIQRIMEVDSFYVAFYDQVTGRLEFPLATGLADQTQLNAINIRDESGITGHVIRSGHPVYMPDLHDVPEEVPYHATPFSDQRARSYIGVPLIFREQVFGVLSIQSHKPSAHSESDVELLVTLATQASIAIQNARAYERLVATADELRELDRLKTQFLANMSHELRTPLNSIIGFSRVMLKGIDGPLTELQEADLSSIHNSGQHLLSLINSILDMSKIEAGKMDLAIDKVSLHEVFDAVLSTTKALVKDDPIELKSDIPRDLPEVWADAQRVRQVLFNLMSNAAKFTEEGHILLKAEAGPEFVTISVRDTGIGIDAEAQNRLFIPFQQVDASTTRRAGGTGLGLAISRSFVEVLGGEIWVDSEPGKGSTFFFTLPVYQAVQARGEAESALEVDPTKKVILAVDDDRGVITLLKRYLENDGYQVIGLMESPRALETTRQLAPHLSAVTLDVVMPHMDGWQVLRALKSDPQTKDVPVILCSVVEGVEQGLALGAAACLQKPVTRDEVLDALGKVERST